MSQSSPTPNQRLVTELKVSAHQMLLDPGVFCVFHGPGTQPPDPHTGLPGVRITRSPGVAPESLVISTFNPDGWLGGENGAALVRISDAPAQVLVTIYQAANSTHEAPRLQVLRLSEQPAAGAVVPPQAASAPQAPNQPAAAPAPGEKPEVAAHVQRRGDLLTRLGDWMGERGSQNWIEGFAILPSRLVEPADIEYQAVLGKGWLSPWAEGGKYCGSRGMALPILGLRVRLRGEAAERFAVRVSASFIDGSSVGPVDGTQTAEAESLAPLEAFMVDIVPLAGADAAEGAPAAEPPVAAAASQPPVGQSLVGQTPAGQAGVGRSPAGRAGNGRTVAAKPTGVAPLAKPAAVPPVRPPGRLIKPGTHPTAKGAAAGKAPNKTGRTR